ncbi:MAG: SIS domain-containing protein [Reyranellaceae bacterium]
MTASFPDRPYADAGDYLVAYAARIAAALASVRGSEIDRAAQALRRAIDEDRLVFVCGNGGSAAIANHLTCDCSKGIATGTSLRPRIVSLSATVELITAIANDREYAEVFAHQLANAARPGDLLITISSSGDSENIVRAVRWAADNGMATVALTGFSGGRSAALADVNLHVAADNYGIVEDVHQSLMHILAQYLRLSALPPGLVSSLRF